MYTLTLGYIKTIYPHNIGSYTYSLRAEKILHLEVDIFSSHSKEVGVTSSPSKKRKREIFTNIR
jgi:hypothetical protein